MISELLRELFDQLDRGDFAWQRRLRSVIGLSAQEPFPGLIWLRMLFWILIWGSAFLLILGVWRLSDANTPPSRPWSKRQRR